ncbi:MAG: Imm3 family immunity protein [Putridiphycobacter sp.]
MDNWEYSELLEAIKETFNEQLLQGLSVTEAIGVTSENFIFYPLENNKTENLITFIETIFLCLEHLNFVYETTLSKYNEQKLLLSEQQLKASLNAEEYTLLMKRIGELEIKLAGSEIKQVSRPPLPRD